MRITRDGTFERTDPWRERKWLDLWSVVHTLSGISIGLGVGLLHPNAIFATVVVFSLLVAYEAWEVYVQIEEELTNRVLDVVVGMASFLPTFFFLAPLLTRMQLIGLFCPIVVANVVLASVGWRASQKAAQLERRMRTRFAFERARLLARSKLVRQRLARKHRS